MFSSSFLCFLSDYLLQLLSRHTALPAECPTGEPKTSHPLADLGDWETSAISLIIINFISHISTASHPLIIFPDKGHTTRNGEQINPNLLVSFARWAFSRVHFCIWFSFLSHMCHHSFGKSPSKDTAQTLLSGSFLPRHPHIEWCVLTETMPRRPFQTF